MTNNNWIEQFYEKFNWLFSNTVSFMVLGEIRKLNTELTRQELLDFISNLLIKKDQEHKAELESIKEKIAEKQMTDRTVYFSDIVRVLDNHK